MGYFGKLEEKQKAIELRKQGLSYSEIRKKVDVSKSTLSIWCRDINLSNEQVLLLSKKRNSAARKGSLVAARNKRLKALNKTKKIQLESIKKVGSLSKRDRFISGIALYLGDGYKTDKRFGFSNANADINVFMMNWLLEFGGIESNKIKARIWLHDNLDEKKAKHYWSELLKIEESNFIKSYVVKNKVQSLKIRKKIHNYGVLTLIVNNKDLQSRMLGFMTGILSN